MEENNSSHIVLDTDINQLSDRAIATIIESLQEEQKRRARIHKSELVRNFKAAAQQLFDANIPIHIEYHNEEIYLHDTDDFFFCYD